MIVALLTITYVPALTVVPEAERTSTINNLVVMLHSEVERAGATNDVTLVDAAGTVLKDAKGQPVVLHFSKCAAITDDTTRDVCQQPFLAAGSCKSDPDPKKCTNRKIADWVCANLNGGIDQSTAIITARGVPLINAAGEPIKDKKTGQPIIKTSAECDKLEGSYQETCKELFI